MTAKQRMFRVLNCSSEERRKELDREFQGALSEGLDEEEAAAFVLDHLTSAESRISREGEPCT